MHVVSSYHFENKMVIEHFESDFL